MEGNGVQQPALLKLCPHSRIIFHLLLVNFILIFN